MNKRGWPWDEETNKNIFKEHKNWPKISIITPSFNQGEFLEETIRSVLFQNYPNLEYIIIDGGSTDDSVEVIKKYEDKLAYWISEKDRGQSEAINKGFRKVTGEIVTWLNSDDYLEKDVLFEVALGFEDSNIGVVHGNSTMFSKEEGLIRTMGKRKIDFHSLMAYWKLDFCPPQPSIFFRRKFIYSKDLLEENLHFAMDYDLWFRLALTTNYHFVDKVFSYYRIHNQSKSGSENGFSKFKPEWRNVRNSYLRYLSFSERLTFHLNVFKNVFLMRVKFLIIYNIKKLIRYKK